MSTSNEEIVRRIKENRIFAKMTQQDVASYLGKTAAAISDLERGNVQVNASDLSKIADLFNIPINSFFKDFSEDQDIQDIIILVKKQPKESRTKSLSMLRLLMDMQSFVDETQKDPDKQLTPEQIGIFFTKLLTLRTQYKEVNQQIEKVTNQLYQVLSDQGFTLPKP